jgi:hypothetical protein
VIAAKDLLPSHWIRVCGLGFADYSCAHTNRESTSVEIPARHRHHSIDIPLNKRNGANLNYSDTTIFRKSKLARTLSLHFRQ